MAALSTGRRLTCQLHPAFWLQLRLVANVAVAAQSGHQGDCVIAVGHTPRVGHQAVKLQAKRGGGGHRGGRGVSAGHTNEAYT